MDEDDIHIRQPDRAAGLDEMVCVSEEDRLYDLSLHVPSERLPTETDLPSADCAGA
ncbi:hypothetical protein [Kibdelosporangium philippinense]|uniref:hypothetical protein n=1 Tax=Kibdelosporangium philippinense TaxID=211113 RepID=UPI003621475B